MKRILPILLVSSLFACAETGPTEQEANDTTPSLDLTVSTTDLVYDIPSLVGLSKAEIDAAWGEPNCPPKNACVYGELREVYFVDGKAANFTLPPTDDPSEYGFAVGEPSFENTGVQRWEVLVNGEIAEISAFEENYFYVKTKEP